MNLPAIIFVEAAHTAAVNAVYEAMGKGEDTVSVGCCAIATEATWETPATHYMAQDMSAQDGDVVVWQAMCEGDLPLISGVWGEAGVISAQDAQAALVHMIVISAAGLNSEPAKEAFLAGALAGQGLKFIPNPPL